MVRVKQRYILGEVDLDQTNLVDPNALNQKVVQDAFKDSVKDCYGDIGIAKLAPNFISIYTFFHNLVKYWNPST